MMGKGRKGKGFIIILSLLFLGAILQAEENVEKWMSKLGIQKVPQEVKDFTLPDLKGEEVSLKDFKGKVVFVFFFASWCPPCREEMPSMEKLYRKFKDKGLVILAVNLRERKERVEEFVRQNNLTFPVLLDSRGEVGQSYGIRAIPTTYILDRKGKVIGRVIGSRDWMSEESVNLFNYLLKKDNS